MNRNNAAPHWIAVDWSESGMRAWALDSRDAVLMKVRSAQGLAQIAPEAFETVLFKERLINAFGCAGIAV